MSNKSLRIGKSESILSSQQFYAIFGGMLLYGFLMNAFFSLFLTPIFVSINPITLLISYIVFSLIGICMSKFGGSILSFVGYNFVVVPFGAVLSVLLLSYGYSEITMALFIVAFDCLIMFLVSLKFSEQMLSLGRSLFISLGVGIIAEIICMLFGLSSSIFDFIFVIIFTGYLGYDFSIVAQYDKTVDNAIDSALDVYLDIINLFLRLLSILGGRRNKK